MGPPRRPRPLGVTVPGILLQGCGVFVLPFLVGLTAAIGFEVAEVTRTLPALVGFTMLVLLPVSLAQVLGLVVKGRRELAAWRARGPLDARRAADVLLEHLRVVTPRGWVLLAGGLGFTVLALALRWASFGLIATFGLLLFYLLVGWTVLVSTFFLRRPGSPHGRGGRIERRIVPAVVQQGEPADDVVTLDRVRIPWGYVLLVEDVLPDRLGPPSRHVAGSGSSRRQLESRRRIASTPRGHHELGPARAWFQDLLGITRISVATVPTAELKVLPRFRPVEILDPPRTPEVTPDVLTRPHRTPTEDHFRFREYVAGDDTRRIHWRLSLRAGHLHVRQPETRELTTHEVLLVLDTFLPPTAARFAAHGADEILDWLVDGWIGVARALHEAGDRVTLAAALPMGATGLTVARLACRDGQATRWQDLGARARWQSELDLPEVLAGLSPTTHAVVATARLSGPPPGPLPGRTVTWLVLDPARVLGPADPHWFEQIVGGRGAGDLLRWAVRQTRPSSGEDDDPLRALRATIARRRRWRARRALRALAARRAGRLLEELTHRGEAVYCLEPRGPTLRVRGVRGRRAPAREKAS